MKQFNIISIFVILLAFSACKTTQKTSKDINKPLDAYKVEIYERYKKLTDATSNVNIEEVMDLTHPKIFEIVPRKSLQTEMENIFSTMKMVTEDMSVTNYSPIYEYEGEKYVLLDYIADMTITLLNDDGMDIKFLEIGMATVYGAENITVVDDKTLKIDVKGKSTFAITSKTDGKWYFLENNKENALYNLLIPKEIQEKITNQSKSN